MKAMLKLSFVLTAALLAGAWTPAAAQAKKKVGILLWTTESRYTNTKDDILAELKKSGADKNVELIIKDAGGKKERVPEVIKELQDAKVDVFVPLGTSAAVPTAKAVTDKPVVFGMVFDPVESKIVKDWKSSENNATGSSSFVSIPQFMRRLVKRSGMTIKKIAVPYTPGEKNSELQMNSVKSVEQELGVVVHAVPIATQEDADAFVKDLPNKADLVFFTGAAMIGKNVEKICEAANKSKIATATHLEDIVEKGALYGLVANANEVGRLAGKALIKVLQGTDPKAVPIEFPMPQLLINDKSVKAGGFEVSAAMKEWAQSSMIGAK